MGKMTKDKAANLISRMTDGALYMKDKSELEVRVVGSCITMGATTKISFDDAVEFYKWVMCKPPYDVEV